MMNESSMLQSDLPTSDAENNSEKPGPCEWEGTDGSFCDNAGVKKIDGKWKCRIHSVN